MGKIPIKRDQSGLKRTQKGAKHRQNAAKQPQKTTLTNHERMLLRKEWRESHSLTTAYDICEFLAKNLGGKHEA